MAKKERRSLSTPIDILLLEKHPASTNLQKLPYGLVFYWKRYLLAFSCLISVLLFGICFFAFQNHVLHQQSEHLHQKLEKTKEYPKQMIAVQKKVQELEARMQKVNGYLIKRGIQRTSTEGGKGGVSLALTTDNIEEMLDQYIFYADTLHQDLVNVPLGYPIKGPFTSGFGLRNNPFSKVGVEAHPGVDIKANRGDIVKATADGKVVYAAWYGGYGKCVVIAHDKGFETRYGHLSAIKVKPGQLVKAGQVIGKVGSTGRSTGPHLHYEINRHGKSINPTLFVKSNSIIADNSK